jgi:hypothetical protein
MRDPRILVFSRALISGAINRFLVNTGGCETVFVVIFASIVPLLLTVEEHVEL